MAEMNCPILGDGKYGGKAAHVTGTVGLSNKLHLHAWQLKLPAMFGERPRVFEAPLPKHFAETLEALNLEV
jgi:23S rRNA pseudouridine955/2504/2580 synthase